jgi:hypothetical protein
VDRYIQFFRIKITILKLTYEDFLMSREQPEIKESAKNSPLDKLLISTIGPILNLKNPLWRRIFVKNMPSDSKWGRRRVFLEDLFKDNALWVRASGLPFPVIALSGIGILTGAIAIPVISTIPLLTAAVGCALVAGGAYYYYAALTGLWKGLREHAAYHRNTKYGPDDLSGSDFSRNLIARTWNKIPKVGRQALSTPFKILGTALKVTAKTAGMTLGISGQIIKSLPIIKPLLNIVAEHFNEFDPDAPKGISGFLAQNKIAQKIGKLRVMQPVLNNPVAKQLNKGLSQSTKDAFMATLMFQSVMTIEAFWIGLAVTSFFAGAWPAFALGAIQAVTTSIDIYRSTSTLSRNVHPIAALKNLLGKKNKVAAAPTPTTPAPVVSGPSALAGKDANTAFNQATAPKTREKNHGVYGPLSYVPHR